MQLTNYREKTAALSEGFQSLAALAHEMKMENAANTAQKIKTRLADEAFHLVVVGEFSRGKSTFVNALLGRQILPSSKNPTTAIISKIVYGDTPDYHLHYRGVSAPQRLSEEAFFKMTAPKEPDESDEASVQAYIQQQEVLARIDFAEIAYPLSFCRDHVEIVDTPGTNDLSAARIEITYQYLNRADAVILLLSATQPLSASEAEFLKERILGNQIADIFFVIRGKDEMDGAEQEQSVIGFITKNLRQILPPDIFLTRRIFLVASRAALFYQMQERGEALSAKKALEVPEDFAETGFPALESALGAFLTEEKGASRLRKYNREAQAILHTIQHDLTVQIGVASHSADEIRKKAAQMEPAFRQAKQRAERIVGTMRLSLQNAGADIGHKCHAAASAILGKAKDAVDGLTRDMPASAMQSAIESAATKEKARFIDAILREWQETFDRESGKAHTALRGIWQDIELEYQRNFQLPAVIGDEAETLDIAALTIPPENNAPDFADKAFEVARRELERGWFAKDSGILSAIGNTIFAAMAGTAGVVARLFNDKDTTDWRDKVREEVLKTYGGQGDRMADAFQKQYADRAEALCRTIQESVGTRIEDMEHQLSELLREKERQEQDAAAKLAYLNQKKEETSRLMQKFAAIVE